MTPQQLKANRVYLATRTKKARRWLSMFYDKGDIETSVYDAIADLMHLCTEEGWDYWRLQEQGLQHHNVEQKGEL